MKTLSTWLDFHRSALKSGIKIARRSWPSTLINVFIIVVMLVLASVFWMLAEAMQGVTFDWHKTKQISLYMQVPSTSQEQDKLLKKVLETDGVSDAQLNSAEDGLTLMQQDLGIQDIMKYLPENPLPAVIDVVPSVNINSSEKLEALASTLKDYPKVEAAKVDMDWVKRVLLFITVMTKVLQILMLLMALALILIIANSLRLIIQDRQEEITVLKFIGASDKFILRPYLYLGGIYGFWAAVLTIFCVNVLLFSMHSGINDLLTSFDISYQVSILDLQKSVALLIFAVIVGWYGARTAGKRYVTRID